MSNLREKINSGMKSMRGRDYGTFDFPLLFCIVLLLALGIVMVYSSSEFASLNSSAANTSVWLKKQIIYAILAFISMMFVQMFDYRFFNKRIFERLSVGIGTGLMGILLVIGRNSNGSTRWIVLGPISIQPSELCKLFVIIYMAVLLTAYSNALAANKDWKIPWRNSLVMLIPLAGIIILILRENLSSALVVCAIVGVMLFTVSDASISLILTAVAILAGMVVYLASTSSYRGGRITAWLHPESDPNGTGMQVMESLYAVGSGGIFGKGLGNGMVKLGHLSEAFNDMIFSVICEELGLIGGFAVILVFIIILWRIIRIAFNAPDIFGTLICIGVATQITIQTLLHIGVCVNAFPNTGMTLPFISYGGSSMIVMGAEIGLVLAVSKQIGRGNE